jgi:GT2 family glycosyltransferase
MGTEPSVGVVIVNYNGSRFLRDCIALLLRGTAAAREIVVVDNASLDGSVEDLQREVPAVAVLRQQRNLGVAAGNNVGIEYCRKRHHDYVLLLNYDTLPELTLLENLLAAADPRTLVSGFTLFWDDPARSNSHAGGFDWTLGRLRERFFGAAVTADQRPQEVDVADTCCLLVPRAVFDSIGVMDDAYFMYYDDTDFVVRARRAGYRCVISPAARLRHYERGAAGSLSSSPVSVYFSTRNRPYFMAKHAPSRLRYLGFLVYFLITRTATAVRWLSAGKLPMAVWMWRGFSDYRTGRMGPGRIGQLRTGTAP